MRKLISAASTAAALAVLTAGAAQAVPLQVQVWDVLAPQPGQFTGNDELAQVNAWVNAPATTIALEDGTDGDFFDGAFSAATSTGGYDQAGVDYILANITPDLTFSIDSSELASGFTASGLSSGSSSPTIEDFFDRNGSLGGVGLNSILGTVVKITGNLSVAAGDTFAVSSDDGYRLTVNNEELAFQPDLNGNVTPITSTALASSSGIAPFELVWFEGNTVGARLAVTGDYVAPVPLPAAAWMLLAGLGGLVALKRRKMA
jgi:hypothetical protein